MKIFSLIKKIIIPITLIISVIFITIISNRHNLTTDYVNYYVISKTILIACIYMGILSLFILLILFIKPTNKIDIFLQSFAVIIFCIYVLNIYLILSGNTSLTAPAIWVYLGKLEFKFLGIFENPPFGYIYDAELSSLLRFMNKWKGLSIFIIITTITVYGFLKTHNIIKKK